MESLKLGDVVLYHLVPSIDRPAFVVAVWPDEFGPGVAGYNVRVFLDGANDDRQGFVGASAATMEVQTGILWKTSIREGTAVGECSRRT